MARAQIVIEVTHPREAAGLIEAVINEVATARMPA
jgi:hypothetical protein